MEIKRISQDFGGSILAFNDLINQLKIPNFNDFFGFKGIPLHSSVSRMNTGFQRSRHPLFVSVL